MLAIPIRLLASFDEQGSQWLADDGTYTLRVGVSCRDIRQTANVRVKRYTEKVNNVLKPQVQLNLLHQ